MKRTRRTIAALAAVAAALAVAAGALAYFNAGGNGGGSARTGGLVAPAAQAVTALSGPRISWSGGRLSPDDSLADAQITYSVERSADGGTTWAAATGTCAGTLPSTTETCNDHPPIGTYVYRVDATYRSWHAQGTATSPASTQNVTALAVTAPPTDSTGTTVGSLALGATLSGATTLPAAGGTITFSYFGPQATPPAGCQATGSGWTTFGTAGISGNGTYHPASGSFAPAAPGTYWWFASYGGDVLNRSSFSVCGLGAATTVVTNTTATALAGPTAGTVGTAIPASSLSAALSGSTASPQAGGTLAFSVFGPQATAPATCQVSGAGWTALGTASVNGDGTYSPVSGSFTPQAPGKYWWYASYGGDTLNAGSASTCGTGVAELHVVKAQPTIDAIVTGGPATGTAGAPVPASSIGAELDGRVNQDGTGTVSFFFVEQPGAPGDCSGGTALGAPVAESGATAYHPSDPLTPLTAGDYWVYAVYSGDANNRGATGTCAPGTAQELVIAKAQPTLTLAVTGGPLAGTAGTAVPAAAITATLAGRVSQDGNGAVTFFFVESAAAPTGCTAGTQIGSPIPESGAAAYDPSGDFTPATAGNYWLYAVYSGDANNLEAAGTCAPAAAQELVIAKAQPSLTLAVTGGPANATAGAPFAAGSITATLAGRVSQDGTGAVSFFFVESAAAPSDCTAGTAIGSPVAESAAATYNPSGDFTPATAGTYWLYAVYSGDANNLDASGACPPAPAQELVVSAALPSVSLSVAGAPAATTAGTPFPAASITATVSGRSAQDGTGTVSFFYLEGNVPPATCTGGTAIGSPVTEGAADDYGPSGSFTPPAAGNYWLYAVFSGDSNNLGSSGTCPPSAAQEIQVSAPAP